MKTHFTKTKTLQLILKLTQLKRESSTGTASASSQSSLEGEYETSGSVANDQVVLRTLLNVLISYYGYLLLLSLSACDELF